MAERGGHRVARLAAQRQAARHAQVRRRRLWLAGGSIVAVIAVVVACVLASSNGGSSGSTSGNTAPAPTGSAVTSVLGQLTSVPAATLDQVGAGTTAANPTAIPGGGLTRGGQAGGLV